MATPDMFRQRYRYIWSNAGVALTSSSLATAWIGNAKGYFEALYRSVVVQHTVSPEQAIPLVFLGITALALLRLMSVAGRVLHLQK